MKRFSIHQMKRFSIHHTMFGSLFVGAFVMAVLLTIATQSTGYAAPVCGDGVWEPLGGEECDDGNTNVGDGCSAACLDEALVSPFVQANGLGGYDVYPLGNPMWDVALVQWALNSAETGGSVLLKARDLMGLKTAFDFGADGSVLISKSLIVKGELLDTNGQTITDASTIVDMVKRDADPDMTRIVNGTWPMLVYDLFGLYDYFGIELNVEIRNIHFHNSNIGVIAVLRANDFAAVENRITADTMQYKTEFWCLTPGYPIATLKEICLDVELGDGDPEPDGWGESFAWGIMVTGFDITTSENYPEYVDGKVVMNDNYIRMERDGRPDAVFPNGENGKPDLLPHYDTCGGYIATGEWREWYNSENVWSVFPIFPGSTNADVDIKRNVIKDSTANGIIQLSNNGTTVVEENLIDMGVPSYHICGVNNGIAIYNRNFDVTSRPEPMGNAYILNNRIIMHDRHTTGISLGAQTGVSFISESVEGNHITMDVVVPADETDPNLWSFGIYGFGTDNLYLGHNKVDGTGAFAIGLGVAPLGIFNDWTTGSALVGNNISNFEPTVASVFFSVFAIDNVLVGGHGSLIDAADIDPDMPWAGYTGCGLAFADGQPGYYSERHPYLLPDGNIYYLPRVGSPSGDCTEIIPKGNIIKGGYDNSLTGEHVTTPGGVGAEVSDKPHKPTTLPHLLSSEEVAEILEELPSH